MMRAGILLTTLLVAVKPIHAKLPDNFVYLSQVAPTILQDIRYASDHNFIGRPLAGYEAQECILTKTAAQQLLEAQLELESIGYSLKVYDCYRPQQATQDMLTWSKTSDNKMQKEFYPKFRKSDLVKYKFIKPDSSHHKGSAIDITIVALPALNQKDYDPGQNLVACHDKKHNRFYDNSIDMGTSYNCFHPAAHIKYKRLSLASLENRLILRQYSKNITFRPVTPSGGTLNTKMKSLRL